MELQLLYIISAFIFGSVVGSFLNVCIYRLPGEESIVTPPSSCPMCGTPIAWFDNIPIISYIILMGKCRRCSASISIKYPLVEGLTGLVCALLIYIYGPSVQFAIYFILSASLIVVFWIDFSHQIIPDSITIPGIALGFLSSLINIEVFWWDSALGILLGGGILSAFALGYYLLTGREGMGIGDIKFLAMIGAFLGMGGVVFTLLVGSVLGSFVGIVIILRGGGDSKIKIPFGPFLSIGAMAYIFFGGYFYNIYFGLLY